MNTQMKPGDMKIPQDLPGSNDFLVQFYKSLLGWLDNPSEKYIFTHTVGLCTNLSLYCEMLGLNYSQEQEAKRQLEAQFEEAGLSSMLPFNDATHRYALESNKYTNPKRLDWIKRHMN